MDTEWSWCWWPCVNNRETVVHHSLIYYYRLGCVSITTHWPTSQSVVHCVCMVNWIGDVMWSVTVYMFGLFWRVSCLHVPFCLVLLLCWTKPGRGHVLRNLLLGHVTRCHECGVIYKEACEKLEHKWNFVRTYEIMDKLRETCDMLLTSSGYFYNNLASYSVHA